MLALPFVDIGNNADCDTEFERSGSSIPGSTLEIEVGWKTVVMSDSEDDKPLAARAIPVKSSSAAVPSKAASASDRTGQPSTSAAQDPLKRKAAQKAPVVDDSDSEDDKPLGARAKPSKPPRPGIRL